MQLNQVERYVAGDDTGLSSVLLPVYETTLQT